VPGYTNPQALNRYSYVLGNPLKYFDPSGHNPECGPDGVFCDNDPSNDDWYPSVNISTPQPNPDPEPPDPSPPAARELPISNQNFGSGYGYAGYYSQYSYCGGGPNSGYNFFDCAANFTQDITLLIEAPFVGLEVTLTTLACIDGACPAGIAVTDVIYNVTGANALESYLSASSTVFTFFADGADDGQIGESSVNAIITTVVGGIAPDPAFDFVIDLYAAGYNHETFPGIPTILNGIFGK
jgi:hypothetical protein